MSLNDFSTDSLGRSEFAERLNSFIQVEHRFVEGSLVIALGSKFGSGKSTFLQMWTNQLRTLKPLGEVTIIPLSAWDSDYYNDPLFALISTIVDCTKSSRETAGLVSAIKDVGWATLGTLNQIVSERFGVDPLASGELAKAKKEERETGIPLTADAFSIYQARKAAMSAVKEELRKLFCGSEPKAIFIIDELDRCRPDYAVSFLEVIKHIFDISGIVFILSADRQQLENSARAAFGQNLDFNEYYRKFVHREVQLPSITPSGYIKLSQQLTLKYLGKESGRNCIFPFGTERIQNISELFHTLNCTPRQINDCFRLLGHLTTSPTGHKREHRPWAEAVGALLMGALRNTHHPLYTKLAQKEASVAELLSLFKSTSTWEWWFSICFAGNGLGKLQTPADRDVLERLGLVGISAASTLADFKNGWVDDFSDEDPKHSRFQKLYDDIEALKKWD